MADYRKDNASFVMYKNWKALFDSLTDEEAGQLIKAIFCFASGEGAPKLDRLISGMFLMITQQMDADGVKWEKKCERNAENIRKRWNKNDTTEYDRIPTNTTDNVRNTNDTDMIRDDMKRNDMKRDDNNNGQKTAEQAEPVRSIPAKTADFERLWALYPRKEGKKEAFAAFQRSVKKGTTVETMENGINSYIKHIKDCSIERQYIKKGSTYFQQEAWNDDYSDAQVNHKAASYNQGLLQ